MFSAVALLSAGGAAVWFSDLAPISRGSPDSLLSILRDRSPGQRAAGAASGKQGPTSAMLSERSPAAKLRPALAPAAPPAKLAFPAAAPPITGTAPLSFAAPPMAIPAFAPGAATGPFFLPPILIPGGDDISNVVVNPPGAGPSPVPGIPEPGTWAMMIIGFGLIGTVMRRRRRLMAAMTTPALPLASTGTL